MLIIAIALSVFGAQQTKGIARVKISFTTPAYAGMPIWLMVDTKNLHRIHYPADTVPSSFGCNQVEISHDGVPVKAQIRSDTVPQAGGGMGGWVSAAGSPESRLPLHIPYPTLPPGKYSARYPRYEFFRERTVTEQSDWTTLDVLQAQLDLKKRWLADQIRNLPSSPGLLVGDALSSLLANRELEVLRVFVQATYNQDQVVNMYAGNSLPLFNQAQVHSEVLAAIRKYEPNDSLAYVASKVIFKDIADQVVTSSLPFLKFSESSQVAAAAHLLHTLRNQHFGLGAATIHTIDKAVLASTDVAIAQKNQEAAHWLANHFGFWRVPNGREALWRLVESGLALEQAMICITRFHDSRDLPRIAAEVEKYESDAIPVVL